MELLLLVIGICVGLGVGGGFAMWMRAQLGSERRSHSVAAEESSGRISQLQLDLARAEASTLTDQQMLDAFRSASTEALAQQSQQLVALAEAKYTTLQTNTDTLIAGHSKAVDAGLKQLADQLGVLEKGRSGDSAEIRTMVHDLANLTTSTKQETAKLASAMRDNRVRGVWGEVQLRRALELAGLDRNLDFIEQQGVSDGETSGRPDVVLRLPNGRCVVIDSKVPLDRYLQAAECNDPVAERALQVEHAKVVSGHVKALAGRDYTSKVTGSIDLILLFLPGEPFLSAALDADATLFESAAARGVHLVTPSSLIPLLRGIALGWREHQATEAAAQIHQLGMELHERIALFASHHAKIGRHLGQAVEAFNGSVGSLETRVLSTARKLSEYGATSTRSLPDPSRIETAPRALRSSEETRGLTEPGQFISSQH